MTTKAKGKATKSVQLRVRVGESEDKHLRKAAKDGGFDGLSAYVRAVLLERHVVVVGSRGVVLVPAAASGTEERAAIEELLGGVLQGLSEPPAPAPTETSQGEGATQGVAQEPPGPGSVAGSIPDPGEKTSPGEGDGVVGTSASRIPPATAEEAAGIPPGPAETISELEEREEPLGPEIQPGEDADAYLARRTAELKREGRPTVIARFEAEAEYRRYFGAPAAAGGPPPAPGPTSCSRCGTLKREPGPCPDCGAEA